MQHHAHQEVHRKRHPFASFGRATICICFNLEYKSLCTIAMADPTCVIFTSLTAAAAAATDNASIKRKDDCGGGDKYIGYGGRGGGEEFQKERVEISNPRNAILQAEAEERDDGRAERESGEGFGNFLVRFFLSPDEGKKFFDLSLIPSPLSDTWSSPCSSNPFALRPRRSPGHFFSTGMTAARRSRSDAV